MARFVLKAPHMRLAFVLVLAACGTTTDAANDSCPFSITDGDACSFSGRCWRPITFSSCLSGWCTCSGGKVTCEAIAPQDGDACGDEPMTQCTYEGTLTCDTPPTAQACSCDETGTWRCTCACYGGLSTCSIDPCKLSAQQLHGSRCGDPSLACTGATNSGCRCESGPDGNLAFNCL